MTGCECAVRSLLSGAAAEEYADHHLVREAAGAGADETVYRCPQTGRRWVQDHEPTVGGHGPRLRRLQTDLRPADLVERLAAASLEEALALMDPDVQYQPYGEDVVLHGRDELRRYGERAVARPDRPQPGALSVIEAGEQAVVLGTMVHPREGRYVEHRPAAWVVTTREGRIIRVVPYDTWQQARRAAGLPAEGGPQRRPLRSGLLPGIRELRGPAAPRLDTT